MKRNSKVAAQGLLLILAISCATGAGAFLGLPPKAGAQKKTPLAATPSPQAQLTATPGAAMTQGIPLPQIAARADELDVMLGEMSERLTFDAALNLIDQALRSQEGLIQAHQRETDDIILSNPTLVELREVEQDWQARRNQHTAWRDSLTERAKAVEETVRSIENQQAQWEATLNQIQVAGAMEAVFERIRNALGEIQVVRSKASELLTLIVALQHRVSSQNQAINDVLRKINQVSARLQRGLWERDSPPLWEWSARRQVDQSLDALLSRALKQNVIRSQDFFKTRRRGLWMIFAAFLASLAINFSIRRRILRRAETEPDLNAAATLFRRPLSLALLVTLILAMLGASNLPILVRNLLTLLFVIPVLRFLPPLIKPVFRPLLYLLVTFGMAAGLWEMIGVSLLVRREVTVGLCLAAVALGAWLIRPSRLRRLQPPGEKSSPAIFTIYVILALVFASLAANVVGYTVLSRVLRSGVILSAFFAVILYTAFIALTTVFALFWQSRQASMFSLVRMHQEAAAKQGSHLLALAAFVLWLYGTLNFFTAREWVLEALTSALTTPITVGAASFSTGDVLTFAFVLVAGVVIAHVIRVILWADVLARLPLKHGLPYAISTITYYVLVVVGFFFALAAAGVELSRFTLLTGAFGVGMGFGLQNVINNFVSGIILLFERPIRIADTLEIGSVTGQVEQIGMRSTSIRTPQGAKVIVPNSNLISNPVTNWTLTEQRRRAELPVEVAYNTDPERVLKLLVEVAASHPDVISDPKPVAIFLGFTNSALGFELRFWVAQFQVHQQVRSDLGVKVIAALREAGIDLALSRRELYVRNLDGSAHQDSLSLAAAPHGDPTNEQQNLTINSDNK